MSLATSLETYLKNITPNDAEAAQIAALQLMALTLDDQTINEGGPLASLLSTYARELARFQKSRSNAPTVKSPLASALEVLDDE